MCATHVLLLLGALPALAGTNTEGVRYADALAGVSGAGPELVPPAPGRGGGALVAAAGRDVELHCTVLHLGDKSVSWVRSRDLQILSHAGAVFTADSRVSASSRATGPGTSVHALRIARLRLEDAGRYECQLNTEPKTSLLFNLTVLGAAEAMQGDAAPEGAAGGARARGPPPALLLTLALLCTLCVVRARGP